MGPAGLNQSSPSFTIMEFTWQLVEAPSVFLMIFSSFSMDETEQFIVFAISFTV
jgi:hypothetical protein